MKTPDSNTSQPKSLPVLTQESETELSNFVSMAAFDTPVYPCSSAPVAHLPFLFWLCDSARPQVIVDVEPIDPSFFFGACQATARVPLDATCHLVGTSLPENDGIIENWADHQNRLYPAFSHMAGGTPTESADRFKEKSIDLLILHADSMHTEQIQEWCLQMRPKLSSRAIVLVHGVEGQAPRLPKEFRNLPTFRFGHARGLDVVAPGSSPPPQVRHLLTQSDTSAQAIRAVYAQLGFAALHAADSTLLPRYRQNLKAVTEEAASLRNKHQILQKTSEADRQFLEKQIRELQYKLEQSIQRHKKEKSKARTSKAELEAVLTSRSWRATAHLRWLMTWLRGAR